MKRIFLIILALFFNFINTDVFAAENYTKTSIKAVAKDGFNINAVLTYPKVKNKREFSTVILLHSLGYNSTWWGNLPSDLLNEGYAVVMVDLRGHGTSIYNSKLAKTSWKNMKDSAYSKYPDDVLSVINTIIEENPKRTFFNNWAIVGSDIGASAGVIAADKFQTNPKTIVMLSPVTKAKGIYIPVHMAQLDGVDFLAVYGNGDTISQESGQYLKKFAQKEFAELTSKSKSSGMLILKNDPQIVKVINDWINLYLK